MSPWDFLVPYLQQTYPVIEIGDLPASNLLSYDASTDVHIDMPGICKASWATQLRCAWCRLQGFFEVKVAVETISNHIFSIVFQPYILSRSSSVDIGVAVNVAFLGIPKLDLVALRAPLLAILDTARGDDHKMAIWMGKLLNHHKLRGTLFSNKPRWRLQCIRLYKFMSQYESYRFHIDSSHHVISRRLSRTNFYIPAVPAKQNTLDFSDFCRFHGKLNTPLIKPQILADSDSPNNWGPLFHQGTCEAHQVDVI